MKPSVTPELPECVAAPGTMSGFHPRRMPALMMSFEGAIAAAEARIAKAESERASWRLCGSQEKYLEACSMVDALELQLDGLRRLKVNS